MKTQQYFKILPLVAVTFSINVFAASLTPVVPEAYEPFTITGIQIPSLLNPKGMHAYPQLLTYAEEELVIGYHVPAGASFPTAPVLLQVKVPGLPPGTYALKTAYLPELATGEYEIIDTELSITIASSPPTEPVYAFFNALINHYFITSWEDEANGLITANDGWELADFGFRAWPALEDAPASAVEVCRFYSSLVNSHFYTGDEEECMRLREEDDDWEYEGIAFQALIPTEGACPAGTDSVWRLYNNRFALLDSNHRFVASSETYRAMVADGWRGEGVAFCSPRQPENE